MNVKEAAVLLSYVTALMPNVQKFDLSATAKAWAAFMPDVSFELGQQAVIKILRSKEIPTIPLPGEILNTVKAIVNGENKVNAPLDYEAWEEVRNKLDFYKPEPKWSHPAIKEAVKRIGSRNICGGDYNVADKFMRIYNCIVSRTNEQYENKVIVAITSNAKNENLIGFVSRVKQINLKGNALEHKNMKG